METNQLICSANQLTGFYMMGTLAVTGLKNVVIQTVSKNGNIYIRKIQFAFQFHAQILNITAFFYKDSIVWSIVRCFMLLKGS